jgi:hypothetical protein
MKFPEENPMPVESRRRIGRKSGQALFGLIFAMFIVTLAVLGPPLTGQSVVPMIELRHDVLMIDREFERAPVLVDLGRPRSSNTASNVRAGGGMA